MEPAILIYDLGKVKVGSSLLPELALVVVMVCLTYGKWLAMALVPVPNDYEVCRIPALK
jgi:hypothetical protein